MILIKDFFPEQSILCIVGPTAVGKTAVGVRLAEAYHGEIISCDSMQVYTGISIASNKPSPEELRVPHHLIDCVSLTEEFDAAQYQRSATLAVDDVMARGRFPIVVGGTGMYLKALLDGIFEGVEADESIRKDLLAEAEADGTDALHAKLRAVDASAAAKIHPNDLRRIVRALEVYRVSGRPISQLQQNTQGVSARYKIFMVGLTMEREELYRRIDDRVEQMIRLGLLEEVRALNGVPLSRTAQTVIGIQEMRAYLNGGCSLEEAKDAMKKNTRRFAKRQLTWFRAEKRLRWIDAGKHVTIQSVADHVVQLIDESRPYDS